ncbi:MAG: hypothetical protein Q9204_005732 [Flavoplaca sp. TL-2023a]
MSYTNKPPPFVHLFQSYQLRELFAKSMIPEKWDEMRENGKQKANEYWSHYDHTIRKYYDVNLASAIGVRLDDDKTFSNVFVPKGIKNCIVDAETRKIWLQAIPSLEASVAQACTQLLKEAKMKEMAEAQEEEERKKKQSGESVEMEMEQEL